MKLCLIYFSIFVVSLVICQHPDCIFDNIQNLQIDNLIDMLKKRVGHKIPSTSIVRQFKSDHFYWFKWLETKRFNLNSSCNSFLQHLIWREHEKLDTIHLEDWSYFQTEYPFYHDTFDKKGRPISELWFSDWNVRKAVIIGKQRQLVRWMIYISEMGMRDLFQNRLQGKNITGGLQLIDYSGFNLLTHGCPSCLQMYNLMETIGPKHYPGIMDEIYILNMSPRFKFLVNILKSHLPTQKAKDSVKMYGNEREWMPVLHDKVNICQLGLRFGGTKDR